MEKQKICFIVASPGTARSFLYTHMANLGKLYEVHLVANFQSSEDQMIFNDIGVVCHSVTIQRKIRLLADIKALNKVRKIFKSEKFTCVHSVTPKAGLLTSIAGWVTRVPHRIHIYTGQVWATRTGFMRFLLKTIDKVIARLNTNLLVDGEGQRRFLIENDVLTENNSQVLANGSITGVELDKFVVSKEIRERERAKFNFREIDVVYIFLGRLTHDKGIGELFQAFDRLASQYDNVKLVLYGNDEGDYDLKVNNYTNIRRNINYFYPGRTSRPYEALQVADVFVIPTWREGFGMSVIEAQGLGLPVITSDAYGVSDATVEGKTGLRCHVGDSMSLYECMLDYYNEPLLRIEHGKAGKKRVEDLFDNRIVSHAWVCYYLSLLGS